MTRSAQFEDLLAEGEAAPVAGWDFSWFRGRATEQRPSWGYTRILRDRVPGARALLDVQTGGGEVLAEVLGRISPRPGTIAATEGWPPNVEIARRNLAPFGAAVVEVAGDAALPFQAGSFDLVTSRHPTPVLWPELARVLAPGGSYLAQLIGAGSHTELTSFFAGEQPAPAPDRRGQAVAAAEAVGLNPVDVRHEVLRTTFHDIAAVVLFLRKVVWTVPDFTVARYRDRLAALHEQITTGGPFVSYTNRLLVEARKEDTGTV